MDWELVDIYADVRSGKNTSGRPRFQRMLEDCRNHKIEMIITKSISRFGRNTVETIYAINELRALLVDIYFENDNIHTKGSQNDFIISILEAYAQAESQARSENIKWGIAKGFKDGSSKLYNRKCFGYRHNQEGELIIDEEEALIVQKIFDLYLNGYSVIAIICELETLEIKSPTGKDRWSKRAIENMLINEKYIGNVLVGKTYSNEFPNNKRLVNKNESDKYLAEDCHPAIISKEKFDRVQAEKARRSNIEIDPDGVKRKSTHYSMKKG
ncbi:recombinase family protein [Desulfosporosinus sp.]|uniref:recombinase family protein n=1 Tax=Desulfosporosinus sp. TaxID=157907 RepID=UPI0025BE1FE3|nr:recombinase family protein [Desulfosporosinus sp.]MBC2727266.1 recombinase family protein [Desulfosporosinus sp.]